MLVEEECFSLDEDVNNDQFDPSRVAEDWQGSCPGVRHENTNKFSFP